MIENIPSQYVSKVTSSWTAYQAAINTGSATLIYTALSVLMIWLNRCSSTLGYPTVSAPYSEPVPAVIEVDGTLKLEYPEP